MEGDYGPLTESPLLVMATVELRRGEQEYELGSAAVLSRRRDVYFAAVSFFVTLYHKREGLRV